ncbi:signal recognition particle-docking protein FtsY [Corynebacterium sp. 13CS0277]|uniref:signal recognition particle-docking protein FtsY n=1 Tax=Corynebacterium sp. 13CS0277 TaxID=2071994 RepID=UPI000D028ECA|nr:signal recognition particle-docking protein FtsY [Corynebacterium sp. 13CS0277]PRQ12541.1 signal recognition particle-docking protein FtsY [Corynebacterium sp. 13CS0277]
MDLSTVSPLMIGAAVVVVLALLVALIVIVGLKRKASKTVSFTEKEEPKELTQEEKSGNYQAKSNFNFAPAKPKQPVDNARGAAAAGGAAAAAAAMTAAVNEQLQQHASATPAKEPTDLPKDADVLDAEVAQQPVEQDTVVEDAATDAAVHTPEEVVDAAVGGIAAATAARTDAEDVVTEDASAAVQAEDAAEDLRDNLVGTVGMTQADEDRDLLDAAAEAKATAQEDAPAAPVEDAGDIAPEQPVNLAQEIPGLADAEAAAAQAEAAEAADAAPAEPAAAPEESAPQETRAEAPAPDAAPVVEEAPAETVDAAAEAAEPAADDAAAQEEAVEAALAAESVEAAASAAREDTPAPAADATPAVPAAPQDDIAPAEGRLGRLRGRLSRSQNVIGQGVLGILSAGDLDEDAWEEIEDTLLMADLGTATTVAVVEALREKIAARGVSSEAEARAMLRETLIEACKPELDRSIKAMPYDGKPAVVLVVGVNGTGKTTTTGKLARVLVSMGHTVLLGAADTFRAAAADQLETWGRRVGAATVRGAEGADPASVAFDAVATGVADGVDVVLVDTAGRLHTSVGLMDQLGKVKRVVEKKAQVDEVLLVLDATIGQNGLMQARTFRDVVDITGVVLTKLDGTAKGGIVFQVQEELGVPVKLVGLGEGADDLAPFEVDSFVDALLGGTS